jgi:enoyl-CoA hydratase/carnithine racemase
MGVAHPLVPPKVALEWFFTGRDISAAEALAHHLVNRVVPHEGFWSAIDEMTSLLAAKSATALNLGRKAYYAMAPMTPASRLDYAQTALTTMLASVGTAGSVPAGKK